MKLAFEPVKNQKFDIGRTINFAKCDCETCDFMHCPKNNYALQMARKKYTIQEFWDENKDDIIEVGSLREYFNFDTISDFLDACITFPKGTYWEWVGYDNAVELVVINRSKHGPDFLRRAKVEIFSDKYAWERGTDFPISYYSGCSDTQEKLAEKIQKRLRELNELLMVGRMRHNRQKQEADDLCDME